MFKLNAIIATLALTACHQGNFGEECNKDGTCNFQNLECSVVGVCRTRTAARSPTRCGSESECFCVTCADKCADAGVKQCAYSDTSVWGSKPSTCECK